MRRLVSLARVVWILAVVAAFAFHLHAVYFTAAKDSYIVLGWSLVVLTFPLGLLPFFAWGLLVGEGLAASTTLSAALALLVMTSVGFFQWFWLVPRLFRWGKSRILASRHT